MRQQLKYYRGKIFVGAEEAGDETAHKIGGSGSAMIDFVFTLCLKDQNA